MKINSHFAARIVVLVTFMLTLIITSSHVRADTGTCGGATSTLPFTDVQGSIFFCSIAEAYFSGLTNGTTPTTYGPSENVTRDQMAAFITRTMDQSIKRSSKRAVVKKWWTPASVANMDLVDISGTPIASEFDGTDIWTANFNSSTVTRIRPGDGKVLETWTGATKACGIVVAMGKIFVCGQTSPGSLYMIDPKQPAGAVTLISNSVGLGAPFCVAFDGARIWVGNDGGSVSIVTLNPTIVTTVGIPASPRGILYDGANIWVAAFESLFKLNSDASVAQTISVGFNPQDPVFDGINIWVPNRDSASVTVVRVKNAAGDPLASPFVLATLTGNGLSTPVGVAFDGERILVTNYTGDSFSLWRASDLKPIGSWPTGAGTRPESACSDGVYFWIAFSGTNKLARF